MAAMSTALTEFSNIGNSRTYTQAAHTAEKPVLVLQKRKVPSGNEVVIEDTVTCLAATEDVDGNIMPSRVTFSATIRRPIGGDAADVTAQLAVFRDIIAGDEFGATVTTQNWLS
jgi:hypothetical protein